MANYTADKPGHTEAELTARTPDAGGDAWTNDGATLFIFKNTGVETTVTFTAQDSCSYGFTHSLSVTVPATSTTYLTVGPFSTARFNDTNGRINLAYSQVTGLTVYAVSTGGTVTGVA